MDIIISLFTPYLKMVVIIKKGEDANAYHASFGDAKKFIWWAHIDSSKQTRSRKSKIRT